MIRIERTRDAELVRAIITHPRIYPYVADDFSPIAAEFDPAAAVANESVYFLAAYDDDGIVGVWMLNPINSICYEVHTCVLPAHWGEKTREVVKEAARWMFANTPCRKVVTHVPSYNRLAHKLAVDAGMQPEGCNRKSWLKNGILHDQYVLGLCKE